MVALIKKPARSVKKIFVVWKRCYRIRWKARNHTSTVCLPWSSSSKHESYICQHITISSFTGQKSDDFKNDDKDKLCGIMLSSLQDLRTADLSQRLIKSTTHTAVSRKVVQQKRTRQCRKVLRVMGFLVVDWGLRFFSDIEGNSSKNVFMPSLFLLVNTRKPQSINAKL